MPANYDGQIVLATNTAAFDPGADADTFLASFNGDLDTGHRQRQRSRIGQDAISSKRVVDTVGLLEFTVRAAQT